MIAPMLLLSGCLSAASAPDIEELGAAELFDTSWRPLRAYADRAKLAKAKGEVGPWQSSQRRLKDRSFTTVAVPLLANDFISALALTCDSVRSEGEATLYPEAAVISLKPGALAQLRSQGIDRGELFIVFPKLSKGSIYKTPKPGAYLLYVQSDQGKAELAALIRTKPGFRVDDLLVGGMRWSAVQKRLRRAVKRGASLVQVRDEVACLKTIPFEADRKKAMSSYKVFFTELDKRLVAITSAWPKGNLSERCVLARQAQSNAQAARKNDPGGRFAALAARTKRDVCAQLDREIARTAKAGLNFTAAGLLLARRSFDEDFNFKAGNEANAGSIAGPRLRAIQTLLGPRLSAIVPALSGARSGSVEALYRRDPFAMRGLVAQLGLAAGSMDAWAGQSKGALGKLSLEPMSESFSSHIEVKTIVKHFTRPNPALKVWRARLNSAIEEHNRAVAVMSANRNYKSKRIVRYRREFVRETSAGRLYKKIPVYAPDNSAMRSRYFAAKQRASDWESRIEQIRAAKPPDRIPTQATYIEKWQVWTGAARRPVKLSLEDRKLKFIQKSPAPPYRIVTDGFHGSDLASENYPKPTKNWTTKRRVVADARDFFAAKLGATIRPALVAAFEGRLRSYLGTIAGPSDRAQEELWSRYILGFKLSKAQRKPLTDASLVER